MTPGQALAWVSSLVLALSAFMGWYSGLDEVLTLSVLGWHTGLLGKLVFFVGLAALVLLALLASGFELPPAVPSGLVIAFLGTCGTIVVLIRVLSIPDDYAGSGRSVGLWISLVAALLLIVAGLLKSSEEI